MNEQTDPETDPETDLQTDEIDERVRVDERILILVRKNDRRVVYDKWDRGFDCTNDTCACGVLYGWVLDN